MSGFVDQAKIEVHSGKGGAGCVSFRREKFVPRGGPDGGNGGYGGNVILRTSRQQRTLLDFKYTKIFKAGNGRPGSGGLKNGKKGRDVVIKVPPGTMVYNAESGELIVDMVKPGEKFVLARGGRGGKGNAHFVSPTHQVPRIAQPGEPGTSLELDLELKLIADVGLVGFPNAGKSTFISVVSRAKPKIAAYPFTTLTPNLGVVKRGSSREFVIADIPGIIEGSHEGKGLGDQFLRHIERTAALLVMIDVSEIADPDPVTAVDSLINELQRYNKDLPGRIAAIIATKSDLESPVATERQDLIRQQAEERDLAFFSISSVTTRNVQHVLDFLEQTVNSAREEEPGDE